VQCRAEVCPGRPQAGQYMERMTQQDRAKGCTKRLHRWAVPAVVLTALLPLSGLAQAPGVTSGDQGSTSSHAAGGPATVRAAQQTLQTISGAGNSSSSGVTQQDYKGSLIDGKATDGVLDLSFDDAIQRGFKTNLGIILQGSQVKTASGTRLQQLQALLPTASGSASYQLQQVNLAAYGLKFPGVNPIVGPFQVVDFRAYLSQSILNINSIDKYLASKHNFEGAKLTAEDARNMVVLTVGNAYLLCIADASRVDAEQAEKANAKVSLDQATANHDAGISPKLDVLRAQVDFQNADQSLISAKNQLEKDKLALARAIGLPLEQKFRLSDPVPFAAATPITADEAFANAVKARKDLQGSAERVKGAEAQRKAAVAEQYPTVNFTGDYGDLGTTPGHSHGTYTATGEVSVPILQIAKTRGDIEVADAALQQQKARYSDSVQQVNADVRDALLDIEAAAKLVEATKSNVDLANEALSEAQQRFKAGVVDNLEVSDAQSQTEQANNQYISALYQHNVAKLSLARATGYAGTDYKQALQLGGK
jgi:outer membrane protein TolC